MMHPLLGIALALGLLAALLKGVRRYQRRQRLHPEIARKLIHVGLGLGALSLPWLFADAQLPVLLAALGIPATLALRCWPLLRRHFDEVIDGVARVSYGEIFFPAGVLCALLLSGASTALYCCAVALLTLADPAAALLGTFYGRRRYRSFGGSKTVEGSCAFFLVALACLLVTLAGPFGLAGQALLLQSLALALALSLVEGCCGWGGDNLSIPLATVVLLPATLVLSPLALGALACTLLALVGLVLIKVQGSRFKVQVMRGVRAERSVRTIADSIGVLLARLNKELSYDRHR